MVELQDQLRKIIQAGIDRGRWTIGDLARLSRCSPSHVSLFVHGHADVSFGVYHRLLHSVGMQAQVFPADR